MVLIGGSELHVSTLRVPMILLRGELLVLNTPALDAPTVETMVSQILTERQRQAFGQSKTLDFAVRAPNLGLFQVTLSYIDQCFSFVMRTLAEPLVHDIAWETVPEKVPAAQVVPNSTPVATPPPPAPPAPPVQTGGGGTGPLLSLADDDLEQTQVIRRPSIVSRDPWQTGLMRRSRRAA